MSNTTTGAAAGATHVTGGPLTTSLTAKKAPGLLLSAIDSRIVKIRPRLPHSTRFRASPMCVRPSR